MTSVVGAREVMD